MALDEGTGVEVDITVDVKVTHNFLGTTDENVTTNTQVLGNVDVGVELGVTTDGKLAVKVGVSSDVKGLGGGSGGVDVTTVAGKSGLVCEVIGKDVLDVHRQISDVAEFGVGNLDTCGAVGGVNNGDGTGVNTEKGLGLGHVGAEDVEGVIGT